MLVTISRYILLAYNVWLLWEWTYAVTEKHADSVQNRLLLANNRVILYNQGNTIGPSSLNVMYCCGPRQEARTEQIHPSHSGLDTDMLSSAAHLTTIPSLPTEHVFVAVFRPLRSVNLFLSISAALPRRPATPAYYACIGVDDGTMGCSHRPLYMLTFGHQVPAAACPPALFPFMWKLQPPSERHPARLHRPSPHHRHP